MISFLSPLFLVGALTAAVPVILHLLKREPEPRIKFAAVKLLKHAPVENTEKHRLRELLLLALRVAALVLLALAFARPFFARGAATASGVTVVALDTSYSLSAPGRFERAKQLAKSAIANTPSTDLVGVITFSDEAEIVAKPGTDRVLAASAVDDAVAGFGGTRYRAALSAASQTLAGRRGTIVVVTDLQESGWDAGDRASVPEGARIEIADVGALPANLAVVSLQPLSDRLVATIRNTGAQSRDVRAHLTIDGRPAGDATASIGANQTAEVTFAGATRGNTASVTVDDPAGIQADNQRFAVLGGASVPSVAVVTGSGDAGRDAFYVQQALGAGSYRAVGVSGAKLASMTDDQLAAHAAIFLLSTRGLERHGRELLASFVRSGGGMLLAAGPDVDGEVRGECGNARPREVPERRAHSRNRLSDDRALHDRRHGAHRLCGRRRPRAGHRLGSRQPMERLSAARDVRPVPSRDGAVPRERAGARVGVRRCRRAARCAAASGDRDDCRRHPSRRCAAARGDQRRSTRVGSGAADDGRISGGGDAVETNRGQRRTNRGAATGRQPAHVAVRGRADADRARGRRIPRRSDSVGRLRPCPPATRLPRCGQGISERGQP
ncbi:MAG: hypothetical protein DMF99_27080 [Acidobacteria bacterium]|nr:MAG: hypothetical protein DMF99_27080 [Acidobacteriota bacterium]